jgi:single-strand DNA-binding protein
VVINRILISGCHNFASSISWNSTDRNKTHFLQTFKTNTMNTLRNKVSLIGHLGKQPEIVKFGSGSQVAKMSLATNESYRDKNGEWIENTQWHNIIAWGKQVERVMKALAKGTEVLIEGRIVNRVYETKAGEKRYVTEIEMNGFLVLTPKPAN